MWNTCGECSAHSEWLQYVAQKEYKRTHDKVCLSIHRALCKKYGVKVCESWNKHKVESVIESDIAKILWDVCIQVDRQIEQWRPDNVVIGALASIPNDLECSFKKVRYIIQCTNFTEVCFTRNYQHYKKSTIH